MVAMTPDEGLLHLECADAEYGHAAEPGRYYSPCLKCLHEEVCDTFVCRFQNVDVGNVTVESNDAGDDKFTRLWQVADGPVKARIGREPFSPGPGGSESGFAIGLLDAISAGVSPPDLIIQRRMLLHLHISEGPLLR